MCQARGKSNQPALQLCEHFKARQGCLRIVVENCWANHSHSHLPMKNVLQGFHLFLYVYYNVYYNAIVKYINDTMNQASLTITPSSNMNHQANHHLRFNKKFVKIKIIELINHEHNKSTPGGSTRNHPGVQPTILAPRGFGTALGWRPPVPWSSECGACHRAPPRPWAPVIGSCTDSSHPCSG